MEGHRCTLVQHDALVVVPCLLGSCTNTPSLLASLAREKCMCAPCTVFGTSRLQHATKVHHEQTASTCGGPRLQIMCRLLMCTGHHLPKAHGILTAVLPLVHPAYPARGGAVHAIFAICLEQDNKCLESGFGRGET